MDNLERNLIETAERAKSNTHRIDELEQTQKTIYNGLKTQEMRMHSSANFAVGTATEISFL